MGQHDNPAVAGVLVLDSPRVVSYKTTPGALTFVSEEICKGGRGSNTTEAILFPRKTSWSNTPFLPKVNAEGSRLVYSQ